jgi:predicted homoserine dehydrogenase-like protein
MIIVDRALAEREREGRPIHIAMIGAGFKPTVEVVAAAKVTLEAGQVLDGIGCHLTYGLCENAACVGHERLLPLGLAEGGRLVRDIAMDEVLSYDDVELPESRLCDRLRSEQQSHCEPTVSGAAV